MKWKRLILWWNEGSLIGYNLNYSIVIIIKKNVTKKESKKRINVIHNTFIHSLF